MQKVQIIIIDSGVNMNHPDFAHDAIRGTTWHNGRLLDDVTDQFGHGTAIYGIIRSVNSFCDITNVKI